MATATASAPLSSLLRIDSLTSRTELVKSDFRRRIELKALPVPTSKLQSCIGHLKKLGPGLVKLATIVDGPSPDTKLVLLDPELLRNCASVLSADQLLALAEAGVSLDHDAADLLESRCVDIEYENYPISAVLSCLLPSDVQLSSFSIVGHIAHFNLTEQTLPYGRAIGEVLISKLANIKTVVHKRKEISTEYRTFELQLLAGVPEYVTVHREFGLEYELDFSQVYWNSRLSTEHRRIVSLLRPGDLVFDLCAGVGPFAVPALKLFAEVYANDLNPVAHRYLEANMRRNLKKSDLAAQPERIRSYNMDARDFVRQVFAPRYATCDSSRVFAIANLPGAAVDLLDSFACCLSLLDSADSVPTAAPVEAALLPTVTIFCYAFVRRGGSGVGGGPDLAEAAALRARIRGQLGADLVSDADVTLRFVRDVASSKDMYCAEIACRPSVFLGRRHLRQEDEVAATSTKKPRLDCSQ